jgi:transcriptional regulator with XRE-family HTH domain
MSNLQHIGERLREERERLRHNQTVCAELGGVTRKTLYSYESGTAAPGGEFLLAIASHGYDSPYVLFGQRLVPRDLLTSAHDGAIDDAERQLLMHFRAASSESKGVIARLAEIEARTTASKAASPTGKRLSTVVVGHGNVVGHANQSNITITSIAVPKPTSKRTKPGA